MHQYHDTSNELFDPNLYAEGQTPNLGKCYKPPTYDEIQQGAEGNLKLLPDDRQKFFEFVVKEQEVRLNPKIQALYGQLNQSGAVEDLIHSELMKHFGYDDVPLNHQLYYALTRKYANDPELKPQIFFWRNNVMHGSRVKLHEVPPHIPLLHLDNTPTSLSDLIQAADSDAKLTVIFGGNSIEGYLAFAEEFKQQCKCYFLYIKEAHFVERDQAGKYVDGWPIGYYDYEFAQHKSQADRQKMAVMFQQKYQIPDHLEILQDVFPGNLFDESFGIWPDNLCVFKHNRLVWRGIINLDGSRQDSHAVQLKEYLHKL